VQTNPRQDGQERLLKLDGRMIEHGGFGHGQLSLRGEPPFEPGRLRKGS
jgi:hypothetical protein